MNSATGQPGGDSGAGTAVKLAGRQIGGKFLTFQLANEEFGMEILKVQEIVGLMPITPVPGTPDYIKGVINLRGKVIPTLDLRLKFGMPKCEWTGETCIIVVRVQGIAMGVVVDKVSDVSNIAESEIESAPDFGGNAKTEYILGLGKSHDKVKILLDIDKVLQHEELLEMAGASSPAA